MKIYVAHMLPCCRTLGPGERGVIWVSGCSRHCPGCLARPLWDRMAGLPVSVVELADQILGWEYIEGLTFSGGEPFEQASAISQLVTMIRQHRDISVMVYTGYTFNELKKSPDPGVNVFLEQIDLLVDGPFIEGKQDNLLWRGSSNQQIHLLTDRYGEWCDRIDGPGEGVEVHVSRLGNVFWAGVPEPGFHNNLKELLRQEGISLQDTEGVWV